MARRHTFGDLPEPARRWTYLVCSDCGERYSARRGDYFHSLDKPAVSGCCEAPLRLMRLETRYIRERWAP